MGLPRLIVENSVISKKIITIINKKMRLFSVQTSFVLLEGSVVTLYFFSSFANTFCRYL